MAAISATMYSTDEAASRIRLEVDLNVNLQRLKVLYPTFTYALSKEADYGCIPLIRAQWTALWQQLQPISIPFDLTGVSDKDIAQILAYIHSILQFFNDLLSDGLLKHEKQTSKALKVERTESDDETEYSKLTTLADLISFRYKPISTTSDPNSSEGSHDLSDEILSLFISFNLGFERDRKLVGVIAQFRSIAGRTFCHTTTSCPDATVSSNGFENEHLAVAQRAKEFCDGSTRLFDLLSGSMGCCGNGHTAKVHLSGFGIKNLDMEMLLSTCPDKAFEAGWYPVKCSEQSLSHEQQTILLNICGHLQESRRRRLLINIHYNREKMWKGRIVSGKRREKQDLAWSYKSLGDLIQADYRSSDGPRRGGKLQERDRRRLQCLLSQSMFYLYQSPWLSKPWDLDDIIFAQEQSSYNIKRPYALCPLRQSPSAAQDPLEESLIESEVPLFMAKFGLLLLQIELGEALQLSKEEKLDEFGAEAALDRHLDTRSGDIKDPVKRVLSACLDFTEHVEQTDNPSLTDDLKSRLVILSEILTPLKEVLELSYADVAKDIPNIVHSAPTQRDPGWQRSFRASSRSKHIERSGNPPVPKGLFSRTAGESISPQTPSTHLLGFAVTQRPCLAVSNDMPDEKSKYGAYSKTVRLSATQHPDGSAASSPSSNSPVLFDDDDHILTPNDDMSGRASGFFTLYDTFHIRYMMPQRTRSRVKIAVLDTGVDTCQSSITGHRELIKENRKAFNGGKLDDPIKASKSFVGGSANDQCGHGTRVAELLLMVAPHADLYVAKISHGINDEHHDSTSHVAEAIDWAVKQAVDIITMSFGLSGWDGKVFDAIERATKSTILFAAASNGGGNGRRTFPATHSRVFCIHASDGKGNDYGGMNPSTEGYHDNWSTLGVAIQFYWDGQTICKSGTSYATPIAAATVANAFDHLDYLRERERLSDQKYRYLRCFEGVRDMLLLMSEKRHGFRYVAPWHLWDCICDPTKESEDYVWQRLLKDTG